MLPNGVGSLLLLFLLSISISSNAEDPFEPEQSRSLLSLCSSNEVYVDPTASPSSFTCCGASANPCASLEIAVSSLNPGGTLFLRPGTHTVSSKTGFQLGGGNSYTITVDTATVSAKSQATVDCKSGPCFSAICPPTSASCKSAILTLSGFSVKSGYSASGGGCLVVEGQGVDISSMSFFNCSSSPLAGNGGAISISNSPSVSIQKIEVEGGPAPSSGAPDSSATSMPQMGVPIPTQKSVASAGAYGGGLYVSNSVAVLIESSTFSNVKAEQGGGGIALFDSFAKINNCSFSNLQSVSGGGVFAQASQVQVDQCTFSECSVQTFIPTGTSGGGGLYGNSSVIQVDGSTFKGCFALVSSGGGVFFYQASLAAKSLALSPFTLPLSVIRNSHFESNLGSYGGGGINLQFSNLVIQGSMFLHNLMDTGTGGAIYSQTSDLTIQNSTFQENNGTGSAMSTGQTNAGAIAFDLAGATTEDYTLDISDSLFYGNSADYGGAITVLGARGFIRNSKFISNFATSRSAGAVSATPGSVIDWNKTVILISGCEFLTNKAPLQGAAVILNGYNVTVEDTLFKGNEVGGDGGGLYIDTRSSNPHIKTVIRCQFIDNSASSYGAGLFSAANQVLVKDCLFRNNSATTGGGGACVSGSLSPGDDPSSSTLYPPFTDFVNGTFIDNNAPVSGGAIFTSVNGVARVTDSRISRSRSKVGAGCAAADNSALYFLRSICSQNIATSGGGCLSYQDFSTGSIHKSVLFANNGGSEGGALLCSGNANVKLVDSTIVNNKALSGGGAFLEFDSSLEVTSSNFLQNIGTYLGGAIYATHSSSLSLSSAVFSKNKALLAGALLIEGNCKGQSKGSTFHKNSQRGLVIRGNVNMQMDSDVFEDNWATAGAGGGGLWVTDGVKLTAVNLNLTRNAAAYGGGLLADSKSVTIGHGWLVGGNVGADGGGGVYVMEQASVTLSESSFLRNKAKSAGGGIAFEGSSTGGVRYSVFEGNSVAMQGAAVYVQRGSMESTPNQTLTFNDLTFRNNRAPSSQGSAFFEATYSPSLRASCKNCVEQTKADSVGSLPAFFTIFWPGSSTYNANQNHNSSNRNMNDIFYVIGDQNSPIEGLKITLYDQEGNIATQDFSSIIRIQPNPLISGLLRGTANQGVARIPPIEIVSPALVNLQGQTPSSDNVITTTASSPSASPGSVVSAENATTASSTSAGGQSTMQRTSVLVSIVVSSPIDLFPDIVKPLQIDFCPKGFYYDKKSMQCIICPIGYWCGLGLGMRACSLKYYSFFPGAYSDQLNCSTCTSEMSCDGGVAVVPKNYWLDVNSLYPPPSPTDGNLSNVNASEVKTYKCNVLTGCKGFQFATLDVRQCYDNYTQNRLCSLCAPNHYKVLRSCWKCDRTFADLFPLLIILTLLFWLAMAVLSDVFHTIAIFVVEIQLFTIIGQYNVDIPSWFNDFLKYFELTIFMPEVIGPDCSTRYRFEEEYILTMLAPAIGLLIYISQYLVRHLIVSYRLRELQSDDAATDDEVRTKREIFDKYRNSLIHGVTNWLDLCYVAVTYRCFQTFESMYAGKLVVAAAPEIEWYSNSQQVFLAVSVVLGLIYVVGCPLFYAMIVFTAKRKKLLTDYVFKTRWGWMISRYEPQYYWWHLNSFARRVFLAAVLVFGVNQPSLQVSLTLPMQAIRIGLLYGASPFTSLSHDILASLLAISEFLFTVAITVNMYLNLPSLADAAFYVSIVLLFAPTAIILFFESLSLYIVYSNDKSILAMWQQEKSGKSFHSRRKLQEMEVNELVHPKDIAAWFRPTVLHSFLDKGKINEKKMLLRVRDRFQTCRLDRFGNVEWIRHLTKSQLHAVLSQALMGASVGEVTIAKMPVKGGMAEEHGLSTEGTRAMSNAGLGHTLVPDTPNGGVTWPPRLERHVHWLSVNKDGESKGRQGGGDITPLRLDSGDGEILSEPSSFTRQEEVGGFDDSDTGEYQFLEARMNMAELTLTFQRHLAMLVKSENKHNPESLRLLLKSEAIPEILGWLTAPSSTSDDQLLLRNLLDVIRNCALDEAGTLHWFGGMVCFVKKKFMGKPRERAAAPPPKEA